MKNAAFIAGDWGTSNLRLSLCDAAGKVLDSRNGAGVASLSAAIQASPNESWSTHFAAYVEPWTRAQGSLPALLCGMIGSNIGWSNIPYVSCPTTLDQLAQHLRPVSENVYIAAGLSCINRNGAPDVMRGEETQIIGAMRLAPSLQSGRHLLCLPGTHTKWALLEDGVVKEFVTAVPGELFALVKEHSVLIRTPLPQTVAATEDAIFERAVAQLQRRGGHSLLQLIFECRSRQIAGELRAAEAATYLSGLLIASDVLAAVELYTASSLPITLIGATQLTELYSKACLACGISAEQIDGSNASLAGLTSYYLKHHGL